MYRKMQNLNAALAAAVDTPERAVQTIRLAMLCRLQDGRKKKR